MDTLPIPKQQTGSAYASRMAAIGHLIGYVIGTVDLVKVFGPSFGDTQFKKLILVAAVALLVSVSVTSWAVTERVLISSQDSDKQDSGIKIIRQIFHAATTLPPRIQAICNIQLCSWIGWFPFLFYSTTFVGEIYFRYDAPHDVKIAKDPLGEIGRIGSLALVCFSLVTTVATLLLPAFIKSPDEEGFTKRPPVGAGIAPIVTAVEKFNKYKPNLITAWMWSHFLFSGAMALTPFAHSFRFAALLVSFCGIPWSLASWAPSAFMGIEINRLSSSPGSYRRLSTSNSYEMGSPNTPSTPTLLRLEHGPSADDGISSTGELAGLYLGILNIYTTIPQFIGTFISMIVFSILEPGKSPELATDADPSEHHGTDGPNAIAVCLFIGAICAIAAAFATKRLKDLL